MMKYPLVGNASASAGVSAEEQLKAALKNRAALIGSVVTKMLNGTYTEDEIKRFDNRENPFSRALLSKRQRETWEKFYRTEFKLTVDLSDVRLPDNPGGFDRVLVIAKGVTIGMVIVALRNYFKVWTYRDDLDDKHVPINERDPKDGSYAIRVRDVVEADEELKNKSAEMIESEHLTTETLLERLIHELKYFKETGKHLDVQNITLCAGSRRSGGRVPRVYWTENYGRLSVDWSDVRDASESLRARLAVS